MHFASLNLAIDLHTFILLPIFSVGGFNNNLPNHQIKFRLFNTYLQNFVLIILSGKIFYLLYVCSLLCREAWSQCGNASKEESMRMYIEELQRVS